MVLDPLTAFSVAGTVIQFVDFGLELFQRSEELYRSVRGTLSVNEELDQTIYQILKLVEKLLQSLGPDGALGCQTNDEYTLAGLCDACKAVAREMISRLNDLKVKGRARAWKSLRAAIVHAWNRDAMMALQKKLEGIKALIESYVLVSVRENVINLSIETSERFAALDSRSQLIIDSLLERRKEFSEELQDQTLAIAQLLSRSEIAILDHLEESKARILGTVQEAQQITSLNGVANDQLLRSKNAETLCRDMTEKSLLEGLQFSTMMQRQEEVTEAYRKTFEWIFQDLSRTFRPWSSFINWLKYEDGIYWINGKAGSGKSTLVRYICDERRTETLLKAWAGPIPLTIASFFFWNSGTRDQRSQSGFLRAILFKVLHQHPELMPIVLPWQWAKRYSRLASDKPILADQIRDDWSISRLKQAFAKLCEQRIVKIKVCIFLDGLDEYEGDHELIAEFFHEITTSSPNIKICVSSRPLLVIGDIFSGLPSLRLQDLTFQDIKFYVNDNLSKHRRFRQLLEKEPIKTPLLVKDIVGRADGVFLWVRLVVESLREGLGNPDEIADLRERLDELPRDLEQLYNHMWGRVRGVYRPRASRIFQIVRAARNQGAVIRYKDDEYEPLTAIALSFAEEESTSINGNPSIRILDPAYLKERCEKMDAVLKTRCAGLLEIHASESTLYESWGGTI